MKFKFVTSAAALALTTSLTTGAAFGAPAYSPGTVLLDLMPDIGPEPAVGLVETLVKAELRSRLVDPDSLQIRKITPPDNRPGVGWMVCVTYNAKNRMGGYVGFQTDTAFFRDGTISDWYSEGKSPIPC